ncbi:MAG: MFS transporter [Thermoprotei archaeon]|mgnify:CR=1 FL=1|nr:MAG: MFS transporter [Thermoprotei archaeon]RLF02933.1 MAG: MFS transporter [Thermoprotei archaeon]
MSLVKYLEGAELSRFHYFLLALSFAVYGFTAMNVMLISVSLPKICVEWRLDPVTTGYMLSAGFIGMFIGAISSGYISDTIGRKRTLTIMVAIASVFTALNGVAQDVVSLSLLRLIAGIGLGGTLPIPGVYLSEYPPARYRGRFVGIVETAWVWGVLLGIFFGYIVIPEYGWRASFGIALIPLVLLPIILYYMPESIRYLENKGRIQEAVGILKKYGLVKGEIKVEEGAVKVRRLSLSKAFKSVWSKAYRKRTIVLWALWASLVYTYYGIFLWLPAFYYTKLGYKIVKTLWWVLVVTSAQVPGYYSAALLLDRAGRKPILVTYLTVAGIACLLMATTTEISLILAYSIVISFFNLGAWSALYTYTPELYPTTIRGTGSGLAASIGRIAGILAPTFTGILMKIAGGSLIGAFITFALIHIAAALVVLLLGVETKGVSLEILSREEA